MNKNRVLSNRSAKAAVLLEQLGYQDIRDMGVMND